MARVLLAWQLGGGAGHCLKLAAIAEGLLAKGHEVWVAARDLLTARQVFGEASVHYLQAPHMAGRQPRAQVPTRTLSDILGNTGFGDAASLDVLCAAWRNLFVAAKPDMLVCDHAPLALLASRWYAVRRVVLGTGFTVPPGLSPLPDLRYWMPGAPIDELRRDEGVILRSVNEILTRDGARPIERLVDLYSDVKLAFLLTFRELDHYPQREAAHYWGAWSMAGGSRPEWPDGRPRVFAYLKPPSAAWRLQGLLAFLRESRLSSLVYVAGGDAEWLRQFETPCLRFVREPVDIQHAAEQCDVAVLNGTAGSVTAFLLAGVPQLNIPLNLEQLILSRRVAELGAGLCANPMRPEQVAARLTALLQDARFHAAAEAFSQRYGQFDGRRARQQIVSNIAADLR